MFPQLHSFGIGGSNGIFDAFMDWPNNMNICRCGFDDAMSCQRCYDNSRIWKAFDECFTPVRASRSIDAFEYQRAWVVQKGEKLCWHRKKKRIAGFLEWK